MSKISSRIEAICDQVVTSIENTDVIENHHLQSLDTITKIITSLSKEFGNNEGSVNYGEFSDLSDEELFAKFKSEFKTEDVVEKQVSLKPKKVFKKGK